MSITETFNHYFEIIPADSIELKQEVYKLRYHIYCIEKNFLQPHDSGLEYDEYDEYSNHYLIYHKNTKTYIATTRLILPNKQQPKTLFPMEIYNQIDDVSLLGSMPRNHLAEISRFCISKQFRRRANEQDLLVTLNNRINSPNLTLALFACAIRMSVQHDIRYWYAIMEPALQRVIASLGINFIKVGPTMASTHYYGMRAPYIIKITDLLNDVAEKDQDVWNFLTNYGQYSIRT